MLFMNLLGKMEDFKCPYDLQEVEVTCNRINGVSCLIFKHDDKIFDCFVLDDNRSRKLTNIDDLL